VGGGGADDSSARISCRRSPPRLFWVVIAFLLVLAYTYRFELYDIGDRVLVELVPGRASTRGRTVELARASSGDFQIGMEVNGAHSR